MENKEPETCPDCGTPLVKYCLECKSAYIDVNKEITIEEVRDDD